MGIKVFTFDCGGVLLRDADLSRYDRWEARTGLAREALRERLYSGEAWSLAERGKLSESEFWLRVGEELGLDEEEALALQEDMWSAWAVEPTVLSLIDRLREHYRIAMVSNATDVLEERLAERYGVADRFETIVNSSRLGIPKPEEGIYEELLRRVQVEPHEVVFIDDRADNVTAAASMGMHVLWFVSPQELERQLGMYLRARMPEALR